MTKIISILNYKGGVGKTTTALNLGTALWLLGKRVLLVDADQQRNLTVTMDVETPEADRATLYEWLLDKVDWSKQTTVYERYDGLYYTPSSPNMADIEGILSNKRSRETVLKKALAKIDGFVDYIIIDCPPSSGILNDNAMTASDGIIIPLDCGCYALQGIMDLLKAIEDVKEVLNPELENLGLLVTRYDRRTQIARKTVKAIKDDIPECPRIDHVIRNCTRFPETPADHKSIFEYAPDSNGADDYMRLAEILTGKKRKKNWQKIAIDTFEKTYTKE